MITDHEPTVEADEGMWIAECFECDWQASDRDEWRVESKADGHFIETGHGHTLTLEDR